jgi:hypothetical protein
MESKSEEISGFHFLVNHGNPFIENHQSKPFFVIFKSNKWVSSVKYQISDLKF